jgi:hypothetical protein
MQRATAVSGNVGREAPGCPGRRRTFDQDEDEPADAICRQVGRLNLPRYFSTWSGHLQACVQD